MKGDRVRRGRAALVAIVVVAGQSMLLGGGAGASSVQITTVGALTTDVLMHNLFPTSLNDLWPGAITTGQAIAATSELCAGGVTYNSAHPAPAGSAGGLAALSAEESAGATEQGCIDFARSASAPAPGASTHLDYYAYALDAVAPMVGAASGGSREAPVTLTLTALKNIYRCATGYTNWKSATGGSTAPIVRFWPGAGSETAVFYATILGFTPDTVTRTTTPSDKCTTKPYASFTTVGGVKGADKANPDNSEAGIVYQASVNSSTPAADAISIYSVGSFEEQWNAPTQYAMTKINPISGTAIGNFDAKDLNLARMTNRTSSSATSAFAVFGAQVGTFSTSNRGSYAINTTVVREANEWYSHIPSATASPSSSTAPVPGVRYVYNVADNALPTYSEAKMMVGFDNQVTGTRSSLCSGDDAATILASGFVPLNQGTTAPVTSDKSRATCREFPGGSYPGYGHSLSWARAQWASPTVSTLPPAPAVTGSAPTSPTTVCGVGALLSGPTTAPTGAVTVLPTQNVGTVVSSYGENTTFWLSPGTYTLGSGVYSQIDPRTGDTVIGAPGAVINGQGLNQSAFDDTNPDVTIEYLTIENFIAPQSQGVVNHDSGPDWTIAHDTVEDNPNGAGVMLGSGDVLEDSCLTENGQYGFQSYSEGGSPTLVTVRANEISYNDTANYTATTTSCGCTGGGKFWDTTLATVTGNYVHNNESVGLWMDTDNAGFNISKNYFSTNFGEGIIYEISYNAQIEDNTFVHNAVGVGPSNPSFPTGAIYISESGSDTRVPTWYRTAFAIEGNVFDNNWSGVVLWENSNRYCGSPANTSSGYCTLIDPARFTTTTCAKDVPNSKPTQSPDYFDDCRWRTQNVSVTDNTFTFTPAAVASNCTSAAGCGMNALFSEYGSYAPYGGWVVPVNISNAQNDHFADNTYTGPWNFVGFTQGDVVSWADWSGGFTDENGSGDHFGPQDAGSTYTP